MPCSGDLVFFCNVRRDAEIRLYSLKDDNSSFRPFHLIPVPCIHQKTYHMLGIVIGLKEFLAVSCTGCKTIRIVDFSRTKGSNNTPEWITVYSHRAPNDHTMLNSELDILFVLEYKSLCHFRVSEDEFKLMKVITLHDLEPDPRVICCVPSPHRVCIYRRESYPSHPPSRVTGLRPSSLGN